MTRRNAARERAPRSRTAAVERATSETRVRVDLGLDGGATVEADTGVPFFDHLLGAFGRHGRFDLRVHARGDVDVDAHHTVEDAGIVLGQAFRGALGDGDGITRFASLHAAMDDALALIAVDVSGRAYLHYAVSYPTDRVGTFPVDLVEEFLRAFTTHAGVTLHVRLEHGRNSHHIAEVIFKGTGIVLGRAVAVTTTGIPSTKGVL
jgi:imidazoleglycerol-phosphate dehydratase